jgi:hypothetical protein
MKIQTSHSTRLQYARWKFGCYRPIIKYNSSCDRSIIKNTILGVRSTFPAVYQLQWEEFAWKSILCTLRVRARCKWFKFGCERSLIQGTSSAYLFPLEGFSWKFIHRTLHAWAANDASLVAIIRAFNWKSNVPSRQYLPENSYRACYTHALQTAQVWLPKVNN